MNLLEVEDLRASYGLLPVLGGVSFSLVEGSIAVLLGLNGAGKTTTVNTIAGLLRPTAGAVRFGGALVSGLPADEHVRRGLALCPEGRHIFPGLSVRVNLELGAWTQRAGRAQDMERVLAVFPELSTRLAQLGGTLSGGEQQMLAIARALMAEPRLLLVDEASMGLSPLMAEKVFALLDRINEDGTTVLAVEQNVGMLPYADQALVMEKGVLTYDGPPKTLERRGTLQRAYLGV